MSRTTINSAMLAVMMLAVWLAPGCPKKYARKAVSDDAPAGPRVRAMLAALRAAGPEGLDRVIQDQAAGGLTERQGQALRAALMQLAKADAVELESLSRFGDRVYRATFRVASSEVNRPLCMLLVSSGGTLRWAGQN